MHVSQACFSFLQDQIRIGSGVGRERRVVANGRRNEKGEGISEAEKRAQKKGSPQCGSAAGPLSPNRPPCLPAGTAPAPSGTRQAFHFILFSCLC